MPQLVISMKVNTQNKHFSNTKIIVSEYGTHHIQTVMCKLKTETLSPMGVNKELIK